MYFLHWRDLLQVSTRLLLPILVAAILGYFPISLPIGTSCLYLSQFICARFKRSVLSLCHIDTNNGP